MRQKNRFILGLNENVEIKDVPTFRYRNFQIVGYTAQYDQAGMYELIVTFSPERK